MVGIHASELRDESTSVRGWPAVLLILALVAFAALAGAGLSFSFGYAHAISEVRAGIVDCGCCECLPPPDVIYEPPPPVLRVCPRCRSLVDWQFGVALDLLPEVMPELPPPAKCTDEKCPDNCPPKKCEPCPPKSCRENGCFPRLDYGCRPGCK